MRSDAAAYSLIAPASLHEALTILASEEQITPIAGGTEVMVALGAGRLAPKNFLSLQSLTDLRFIDESHPDTLRIGSGTTFTDLRKSSVIAKEFPLIAQTASWTGSIANQNRGTLGGNIANASPAADTPPALLAYDAVIELISTRGTRTMPYADFHLGYKKTALATDELIHAIHLPRRFAAHTHWVRKVGTRNAQSISKVAIAITHTHDEVRIGAASLLDRPARLYKTEAAILNHTDARAALASEAAPIDDIRSTARYRIRVAQNLITEFLSTLA